MPRAACQVPNNEAGSRAPSFCNAGDELGRAATDQGCKTEAPSPNTAFETQKPANAASRAGRRGSGNSSSPSPPTRRPRRGRTVLLTRPEKVALLCGSRTAPHPAPPQLTPGVGARTDGRTDGHASPRLLLSSREAGRLAVRGREAPPRGHGAALRGGVSLDQTLLKGGCVNGDGGGLGSDQPLIWGLCKQ